MLNSTKALADIVQTYDLPAQVYNIASIYQIFFTNEEVRTTPAPNILTQKCSLLTSMSFSSKACLFRRPSSKPALYQTLTTDEDLKHTINAFDKALAKQQRRKQPNEINRRHQRKQTRTCTNQPHPKTNQTNTPRTVDFKLKIIKTIGDKEHGKPLFSIDCKGIFEKEIDQEVVSGEIDFAVHSLKDVPIVEQQTGTVLAAIPKRDSQHDVFISKNKVTLNAFADRRSCWNRQPAKTGRNQIYTT